MSSQVSNNSLSTQPQKSVHRNRWVHTLLHIRLMQHRLCAITQQTACHDLFSRAGQGVCVCVWGDDDDDSLAPQVMLHHSFSRPTQTDADICQTHTHVFVCQLQSEIFLMYMNNASVVYCQKNSCNTCSVLCAAQHRITCLIVIPLLLHYSYVWIHFRLGHVYWHINRASDWWEHSGSVSEVRNWFL